MYLFRERPPYARLVSIFSRSNPAPSLLNGATSRRIESIDVLRGLVMVIMVLDHTRDYFHADAFIYSPTDLSKTSVWLFCTRWITHFCAPVFMFLAGISAYQFGLKKGKEELVFFLWTRGLWLIFVEVVILSLIRTFNPTLSYINLQVIWAIGLCMIALAALVQLNVKTVALISLLLITFHNTLDTIHASGNGAVAFVWSVLHDVHKFTYWFFTFSIHYPVMPWIGLMGIGYYIGRLYAPDYDPQRRRTILLALGLSAIAVFINLRYTNWYGDLSKWTTQKNQLYSFLSFFNVTKYPPSLLYILITIGPALVFLGLAEKPLNAFTTKLSVFGRTAMFYYLAHLLLLHTLALFAAKSQGYAFSDMVLSSSVYDSPALKGYGFSLPVVYIIWISVVLVLYPICKWYDQYKRRHIQKMKWLSYL